MPQETPDLAQAPVQHGVHAHEARPVGVGGREGHEGAAVRICAARADEDGAHGRVRVEIEGKGVAEGADWEVLFGWLWWGV